MKTALTSSLLFTILALSVVTASSPAVKPEEVGLSSERLQRISRMIQRHIAAGDLAGAVTIVARKGKVAHLSALGVMDLESKQPMTPAAMFRIASMTKPVVGVAIMMMVEEARLHLNDPVSRYIPEFRVDRRLARPVDHARETAAESPRTSPEGPLRVPSSRPAVSGSADAGTYRPLERRAKRRCVLCRLTQPKRSRPDWRGGPGALARPG